MQAPNEKSASDLKDVKDDKFTLLECSNGEVKIITAIAFQHWPHDKPCAIA
jgi:hypothetical protein